MITAKNLAILSGIVLIISDIWILIKIEKEYRKALIKVVITGNICCILGILLNVFSGGKYGRFI